MTSRDLNLPQLSENLTIKQAHELVAGVIKEMDAAVHEYESWLASAAVKYGVDVSIGDYGSGKFVARDEYTARSYGVEVGDWVHSSQTC